MKGINLFRRFRWIGSLVACSLLFMSCASTKPPTQKIAQTEAAIKQAEQVGAQDYAPLEIREARKKLERARKLVGEEEYEKASLLADEATVDAELAEIKSLSGKAQKAVNELRKSIKILKEEINRNQEKNNNGGG